jgi:gas vesicle protein
MKEETTMNKDHAIGFGIGLLAGAVIGGVIALLYAPQSGKETRQMIREKTGNAVDAIKEKAGDVIDTVKETASEVNKKGQAVIQAIKS